MKTTKIELKKVEDCVKVVSLHSGDANHHLVRYDAPKHVHISIGHYYDIATRKLVCKEGEISLTSPCRAEEKINFTPIADKMPPMRSLNNMLVDTCIGEIKLNDLLWIVTQAHALLNRGIL